MKKLNKKIFATLIAVFLILNIMCSYNIFAATVITNDDEKKTTTTVTTNEDGDSKKTTESTDGELVGSKDINVPWSEPAEYVIVNNGCIFGGGTITYEDLCSHGDLLCSQRGTLLTGSSAPAYDSLGESSKGKTHDSSEVPDLTPVRTQAKYTVSDRMYPTPEETFILAFAQHEDGAIYGEYTAAQLAFWNTNAGRGIASENANFAKVSSVNAYSDDLEQIENEILAAESALDSDVSTVESKLEQSMKSNFDPNKNYNNLNDAAKEFQKYIMAAAGVTKVEDVQRQEDGYFKLNYEPAWVEGKITFEEKEYDCSSPTVVFDEATQDGNNILVGPFAIDYVYDESFAKITNVIIDTDDRQLEYGTDWEFSNVDKSNTGYPKPNAPFYIVIKNKYNATKIKNIHVDFEYTNAKGAFNYFYGEIKQSVTDLVTTSEYVEKTDADGNIYYVKVYTYEWSIQIGTLPSQRLVGNIDAEIRKFKTSIDRETENKSQVEIEKIVVDENGNVINLDKDVYFDFKLTVDGATSIEASDSSTQSENIRVKGNAKATSKSYTWKGDTAPTYKISEINWPEGYELVSIEPASGKLEDGKTIKILAINRITPQSGSLDIIKKAEESSLGTSDLIDSDDVFEYEVTISGKFKYNDGEYKEQTITVSAKVNADGNAHTVIPDGLIEWYDDEAPKYSIKEVNLPDGVTEVSITPSEGALANGTTSTAVSINKQETEKGRLKIIKTLDNTAPFTQEELEEMKYVFSVKVDGYEEETIEATHKLSDGKHIWECESRDYEWLKGQNPNYTIKEIESPEGTVFDSEKTKEANANNTAIAVSEDSVTGKLVAGEESIGVVENYIINKVTIEPKKATLKIIKKVDEDILADRDYNFAVTVTGTFDYKGQHFEKQTIQLTTSSNNANGYNILENSEEYNNSEFVVINASKANSNKDENVEGQGEWNSDEFTWYGDAPKYKVEENLSADDINHTVTPSSGTLRDKIVEGTENQYLITITAWNGHDKVGYIHIIKELENADKCSTEYIKSLNFKFKIKVDGYEEFIVTLKPELKDNKWVWEYTSDQFSWRFDEEAPKYTIEEVEIPEGIEFVSANGQNVNKIEGTLIENTTADEKLVAREDVFVNKSNEHTGYLTIDKKVTHDSLKGKEFKFDIVLKGTFIYGNETYSGEHKITDVTVSGESSWTSEKITWCGNTAPTYVVEEKESDIANKISIQNDAGTIKEGSQRVNVVTATNGPVKTGGYLEITKQIADGITTDDIFTFEITIGNNKPYTIQLKANETYKSDYIEWYVTESAPKYEVKEINLPEGTQQREIKNGSGTLESKETISVVAINEITSKTGKFKVTKEVIPQKYIDPATSYEFEIEISISGTFRINDEIHYKEDGDYVYTEKIKVDISKSNSTTYVSPEITWWGENAPTVTVKEVNLPKGWQQVGTPSNNGASLKENEQIEIVVTNELPIYMEIDLTIDLAGEVWEDVRQDSGKNMLDSVPNGKIDESEDKIKGVEVYVYRVVSNGSQEISRTIATGYADNLNSELTFPILTNENGVWEAPRVEILALTAEEKSNGATSVRYDVEFVYDGQTYEPTIFLSKVEDNKYVEGNASEYINASTSERDKFADKSMAKDYNREEVNNRIQNIYGKTVIDGNGDTVGTVSGANNTDSIYYEANVTGTEGTRVESELITTDSDGIALDVFKTKARTSVGGLVYPFDSRMHLENYDITLTGSGLREKYTYSATYNYCLHINLGLVRRADADVEIVKDLYSAKVVVDGEELDYRFNKLADIGKDSLNRHVEIDNSNISYELGLYNTDYYYRAEMYRTNTELYNAVSTFYKSIGKSIEETELDVYLTYKISLYNQSGTYLAQINSVDDYVDESLGKPVQTSITKVIDGVEKEVANSSYILVGNSKVPVEWVMTEKSINGSDGVTYNKMTTNLNNVKLVSGEKAEIYVTFAVEKENIDGVKDAIKLGNKSNIAEIASYSTYYQDGTLAGKIDEDSAPANVNIRDYNDKTWYEDDTDAAPVLTLKLNEENRTITGTAWEDKAEAGTSIGNGVRDDNEALIGGLTTQLIEKVEFNGIEYDFLWPTNEQLNCLGGKTLEYLTGGFASTIETSRTNTDIANVGEYKFNCVPTGEYVVRFIYGNDKTELDDLSKSTLKPAEALKNDGTSYYDSDLIYTSNYDGDLVIKPQDSEAIVETAAVYNGQDYKSTIYQAGFANMSDSGYVVNEWHDLGSKDLLEAKVSDARDSEARRLEVIANSQTITNVNGSVLATANDLSASHTDLYNDYYMFADTAKLNLNIESENMERLAGVDSETVNGTIFSNGVLSVEKQRTKYAIENIDIGLIERPETAIVLDKEINGIKIITNDNRTIFDAIYDISYEVVDKNSVNDDRVVIAEVDDKYLVAKVELNSASIATDQLQAIDKSEIKLTNIINNGTQNFRYINIDHTILEGTTIEIDYLISALNVGEVDYASDTLAKISERANANQTTVKQEILNLAKEVKEIQKDGSVELGKYLGTSYYTGNCTEKGDVIVTSKVRQIVDYIDVDADFSEEENSGANNMWRGTTITELTGSGYEANRLIDRNVILGYELVDDDGHSYAEANSLILSVDSQETDINSNAGFESNLVPYTVSNANNPYGSQITLKVTKVVSAETDTDNLTFDNIAEIVKFENVVGRRDEVAVTGNANPTIGEFKAALNERDSSATELITLAPPTGNETGSVMTIQILIVTLIALGIVVGGIVVIKKKVLKK